MKLLIVTQTKLGRALLLFHRGPRLELPTKGLVYSAKVAKGETPRQIIIRHLSQIKKVGHYSLFSVKTDGTGEDQKGHQYPRLAVLIGVPYFPTKNRRFKPLGNAHMSWVQLNQFEKKKSLKKQFN